MKTKKNIFKLMSALIILALGSNMVRTAEVPAIQWNEMAQSQIINNNELTKLRAAFPTWKIKQISWPSATEISSKQAIVDEKQNAYCIEWIEKFMKKGLLPTDLDEHLIAMKNWGLIKEESKQKRMCDVFIARFKKFPYVIHIQESPSNVVIAIADERLVKDARADHENLLIETATSILNDELKPNLHPDDFHVSETVREGHKITKISWTPESIIVRRKENGVLRISLVKASEIGTKVVVAETDGRFVRFEIRKCVPGPHYPNPYVERF